MPTSDRKAAPPSPVALEQKIDNIARGIDGIKLLLQGLNVSAEGEQAESGFVAALTRADSLKPLIGHQFIPVSSGKPPVWDHSDHIIHFVKAVVDDRSSGNIGVEESQILSSLRDLIEALENPGPIPIFPPSEPRLLKYDLDPLRPPVAAVVAVLRWAKDHQGYNRIVWISRILPLGTFSEICRKIYFAVDDYTEADLIIAYGPSNIRDSEITITRDSDEPRPNKLARIQGKVYDQLYSPVGLSRLGDERGLLAQALAEEIRDLINQTRVEISSATAHLSNGETDPMLVPYLQFDVVCQSSLLTLILRAIPTVPGSLSGVSDDLKWDPYMVTKYVSWAILHTPFVPFNILFTRAVRLLDLNDLARLDRFAASLRPEGGSGEAITHPHRLYELLCETAHLYIDSSVLSSPLDPFLDESLPDSLGEIDFVPHELESWTTNTEEVDASVAQAYGLSDWFSGNQQIMGFLDDDVMF
ncbi:Fc.00g115920.m01.CDS01 [Cosmosporella sp. VM-42]